MLLTSQPQNSERLFYSTFPTYATYQLFFSPFPRNGLSFLVITERVLSTVPDSAATTHTVSFS